MILRVFNFPLFFLGLPMSVPEAAPDCGRSLTVDIASTPTFFVTGILAGRLGAAEFFFSFVARGGGLYHLFVFPRFLSGRLVAFPFLISFAWRSVLFSRHPCQFFSDFSRIF